MAVLAPFTETSASVPSSFTRELRLVEELDHWMDQPKSIESSSMVAHGWIATARRSPELSRAIIATMDSDTRRSVDVREKLRRFASLPDWLGLADRLADPSKAAPIRGDERALALTARVVAERTGRCHPDSAYWHALIEPKVVQNLDHAIELEPLEAHEACRVVARWSLDVLASSNPRAERGSVLSSRQAIRALESLAGEIDPASFITEAKLALDVEQRPIAAEDARRLASLARLAGYRQESHWHDSIMEIVAAKTYDELAARATATLRQWVSSDWGIWIATAHDGNGMARWVLPNEPAQLIGFEGPADELESGPLPSRMRSSEELLDDDGSLAARIYSLRPLEARIRDRWLPRFASAISAAQRRISDARSKAPEHRRLSLSLAELAEHHRRRLREAVGEFSAGAGHEINNPLGAISGHAQRLLREETDPDRRHALNQIHSQVSRIRRMIRDLQFIGGSHSVQRSAVALSDVMLEAAKITESQLESGRRVFESCDPSWQVQGDRQLLARMVSELVINGANAAGPEGTVRVSASVSREDANQIEIVVVDSGPGLTREQRSHALVPFYSGREAGRGLGMGLPVAERIATDHGGDITISFSRPTTVRVQLPAA